MTIPSLPQNQDSPEITYMVLAGKNRQLKFNGESISPKDLVGKTIPTGKQTVDFLDYDKRPNGKYGQGTGGVASFNGQSFLLSAGHIFDENRNGKQEPDEKDVTILELQKSKDGIQKVTAYSEGITVFNNNYDDKELIRENIDTQPIIDVAVIKQLSGSEIRSAGSSPPKALAIAKPTSETIIGQKLEFKNPLTGGNFQDSASEKIIDEVSVLQPEEYPKNGNIRYTKGREWLKFSNLHKKFAPGASGSLGINDRSEVVTVFSRYEEDGSYAEGVNLANFNVNKEVNSMAEQLISILPSDSP